MEIRIRTYKKELGYSYALGASPAIELLQNRPDDCFGVMFSPSFVAKDNKIKDLCEKYKIPCEENRRIMDMLSPKENCYVAAAFYTREHPVDAGKSHMVLDNPSDMGNIGAIMRSCAGFGINDIAIVGGGADANHPKAVRASMGAYFHMNIQYFPTIGDYLGICGAERAIYTFMLDGECNLSEVRPGGHGIYSLVFGNEASGLDGGIYKDVGKSVVITHTGKIDSLSLPVAAGIALFWFADY